MAEKEPKRPMQCLLTKFSVTLVESKSSFWVEVNQLIPPNFNQP